ncbi:hypothetical protein EPH_0001170 [Eimeria praecox]|uniref:Uncharacterized protein n=1 Tax=Eimeria praecox TaxID=51316 RepID=U6G412_9EIME|nr:hypothetical protein EPH_0001170 [Eimeria praecox]
MLKERLADLRDKAKEKDEQLDNLRRSLADLRDKAERAEPLLGLESCEKLELVDKSVILVSEGWLQFQALKEPFKLANEPFLSPKLDMNGEGSHYEAIDAQKHDTCNAARVRALHVGKDALQDSVVERSIRPQRETLEMAQNAELLKEARDREKLLYQQLQQVQCDHETLKKENQTLKHALMNTAQESVDKEDAILRDKREFDALRKQLENATRNAQDCRYLAQMERERRIAQVTQLKAQLAKWQRMFCHQDISAGMEQYAIGS